MNTIIMKNIFFLVERVQTCVFKQLNISLKIFGFAEVYQSTWQPIWAHWLKPNSPKNYCFMNSFPWDAAFKKYKTFSKELSFCHKLKSSDSNIFAIDLKVQT